MASAKPRQELEVAGRLLSISSPDKIYFPDPGLTKLDVINHYIAMGDGVLRGVVNRPMVLKRYVKGATGDFFFQKRAPKGTPEWIETVQLSFPSGRTADEVVPRDLAAVIWAVGLGCIDLNPHAVRTDDLSHPDELRIDLDPQPDVPWNDVCSVALVVREVLEQHNLTGFPKTSGSRGIHIYARIEPRWGFDDVRRAALAVAREVEARAPDIATSKWWKEERHGVFLDYNQNAKDRTIASVYSIRPVPDARVSAPLLWDEVPTCDPAGFTVATMPARIAEHGDIGAAIDDHPGALDALLELVAAHERDGMGDAPWPPHYRKRTSEPRRVQPSKRKKSETDDG